MSSFSDGALQARIVRIAREEGDKSRLAFKPGVIGVEVAERLEAGDAANRFCGTASRISEPWVNLVFLKKLQRRNLVEEFSEKRGGNLLYVIDIVEMEKAEMGR